MAKQKAKKYLIESSTVRSALGDAPPAHVEHLREAVRGGSLWTSVYIRMEYIRRNFCDDARMAFTIAMCTDVSSALNILEQDFKPRNVKGTVAAIAAFSEK